MKYRKKAIVIEAIQLTNNNFDEVESFVGYNHYHLRKYNHEVDFMNKKNPQGLFIQTLEGDMIAQLGDYVIKGIQGEFYPCKPDIFKQSYVEDTGEVSDLNEEIGTLVDKIHNYQHALNMQLTPTMHIEQMKSGLKELQEELREIIVKNGGEDIWD